MLNQPCVPIGDEITGVIFRGQLRHLKIIWANDKLFDAAEANGTPWGFHVEGEGVTWIREHHDPDTIAVKVLLVAWSLAQR